jgi:hypothetical protein
VSVFDVFSKRAGADDLDLPRPASDAELVAWGSTLGGADGDEVIAPRARPPRRRPLVAADPPWAS